MANHPGDRNDPFTIQNERAADKTSLLPSVRNAPTSRMTGLSRCPNCGAPLPPGTSVCPECGEFLREKAKKIRCRRCGGRASSSLMICPHCGRDLVAAPPRLFTWGAPVILVALFLVVLVGRGYQASPVAWLQNKIGASANWMKKLGDNVAPSVDVSTEQTTRTPIALTINLVQKSNASSIAAAQIVTTTQDDPAPTTAPLPVVAITPTVTSAPTSADTPTTAPTATSLPPTATPVPTVPATATATPLATATATSVAVKSTATAAAQLALVLVPTATSVGASAAQPSESTATGTATKAQATKATAASATKTIAPTSTPTVPPPTATTPAPTNTSAAQNTYVVQVGDTLNAIANRFNTDNQRIMEANGLTNEDVYRLHPGQTLIIPPNDTTNSTEIKASAAQRTYTIQAGDTPIEIANTFGISVAELLAANNLSSNDARNLRVGQVLTIPGAQQADSQATPTVTVEATDTPLPSTTATSAATDTPAATPAPEAKSRLDAPHLRSPENSNSVSCSTSNALVWQSVPFMLDNDRFVLHLGFVNGHSASGAETVTWVLEQVQAPSNTAWNMDNSLCALAPQNLGRQWRWYIEVIDVNHNAVSPPSAVWGFSWN